MQGTNYIYFKAKKEQAELSKEDRRWAQSYMNRSVMAMALAIVVMLALFMKFIL
jgi:hypothetical protein